MRATRHRSPGCCTPASTTSLRRTGSWVENAETDAILTAARGPVIAQDYLGGHTPEDPEASPPWPNSLACRRSSSSSPARNCSVTTRSCLLRALAARGARRPRRSGSTYITPGPLRGHPAGGSGGSRPGRRLHRTRGAGRVVDGPGLRSSPTCGFDLSPRGRSAGPPAGHPRRPFATGFERQTCSFLIGADEPGARAAYGRHTDSARCGIAAFAESSSRRRNTGQQEI